MHMSIEDGIETWHLLGNSTCSILGIVISHNTTLST